MFTIYEYLLITDDKITVMKCYDIDCHRYEYQGEIIFYLNDRENNNYRIKVLLSIRITC